MTRVLNIFIFALLMQCPLWAIGGTCPSGANYIDLNNPSNGGGNGSVTLSNNGVTNCYFVSAAGSDSNAGTSESSAWLHSPGMPACSSSCLSATISSGTGIIFRGGDAWHKSSGSPGTGGVFSFGQSGSSINSPIYLGVDFTWYSGVSFARPVLNEDNSLTTGQPATCSFDDDGTAFFSLSGKSNVIVDGLEFTGDCAGGSGTGELINPGTANVLERLYIHGWSFASTASGDTRYRIGGVTSTANRFLFIVMDGADSTYGAACTTTSCVAVGGGGFIGNAAAGWGFEDCWDVEYSIIRHVSNMECGEISIIHDNLFEFMFEPTIGGQHGNVLETIAPGSSCNNFFFYNNVVRNVNEGVGLWPQCNNFYYFNNVLENDGHFPPDANGVMASPPCNPLCSGTSVITMLFSNNTADNTEGGRAGPANANTPGWASGSTATFTNDHLIGVTSVGGFFTCSTGDICLITNGGNDIFETLSTANGQGYTLSNNFAPTSLTGATVAQGLNNTSACNSIPNADAAAACKASIGSVVEVADWGGNVSHYPAVTVNARPSSGAWDAGAYQFSAGTPAPALGMIVDLSLPDLYAPRH